MTYTLVAIELWNKDGAKPYKLHLMSGLNSLFLYCESITDERVGQTYRVSVDRIEEEA